MDSLLSKKEKIAALLILISIMLFSIYLVGIAVEKNLFAKITNYHTVVKDGEGLRPGVEISFLGVKIGEVSNITILKDNSLRIDLEVYDSYTDWVVSTSRLIIERRFGIGAKEIKLLNDGPGPQMVPNSFIKSTEKLDIVELINRIDFIRLVETFEKTVYIAGKFIEQIDKKGRIEHLGEVIDNLSRLIENIDYIVTEGKAPMLELLNDSNLRKSFASLNNFFNSEDLQLIIKEMAQLSKDQQIAKTIKILQKNIGSTELNDAIRSANAFFNNPDLYAVIKEGQKLVSNENFPQTLKQVSQIIRKLDHMLPESEENASSFETTFNELAIVLKQLQQTWFMDEKTREAVVELVVVLKAMQRTWLLNDETKDVLDEQARKTAK